MLDVQDDQRCGDDVTDAPGAQADVAQGFESGLEQAVAAFPDRAQPVVGAVELLLDVGELPVLRGLERHGDGVGFTFVTQVGQGAYVVVDPGESVEQVGVGAQAGGVVFSAGPDRGGPQRPAVRGGQDLGCCRRGSCVSPTTTGPPRVWGQAWRSGQSRSGCRRAARSRSRRLSRPAGPSAGRVPGRPGRRCPRADCRSRSND
jgi:hypothetical protein